LRTETQRSAISDRQSAENCFPVVHVGRAGCPLGPPPKPGRIDETPGGAATARERERNPGFALAFSIRSLTGRPLGPARSEGLARDGAARVSKRNGTRRSSFIWGAILLALAAGAGCRQDMQVQPKFTALEPSSFFDDGRSARPLPEGAVARGHLDDDAAFYTGKGPDGKPVNVFPFPITLALLERGRQRFDIYCSPCHDRTGSGEGMAVRRGFRKPPSLHTDRLRQIPNGHIFDVITNGFGAMPDYAAQVTAADRWAIVAYERALQLSQNASLNDAPPEARAQLGSQGVVR